MRSQEDLSSNSFRFNNSLTFNHDPKKYPPVIELTTKNFQSFIDRYDLVFITFYVPWCKPSHEFKSVFEKAADMAALEFSDKVLFARVNCQEHESLAKQFKVIYYPQLHFVLYGQVYRDVYKGPRTDEFMLSKIRSLLFHDPIRLANDFSDYEQIDKNRTAIIAYSSEEFDSRDPNYEKLRRAAIHLEHICCFVWAYGELAQEFLTTMSNDTWPILIYKPPNQAPIDCLDIGIKLENLASFETFHQWTLDRELPLFFEYSTTYDRILFESSPTTRLILYHDAEDTSPIGAFYETIKSELEGKWQSLQLIIADGSLPIYELDAQTNVKPIVALMGNQNRVFYRFKGTFEELQTPGQLKQFLDDFNSGELEKKRKLEKRKMLKTTSVDDNEVEKERRKAEDEEVQEASWVMIE